jgi:flagellar protein FlgJ
MEITGLGSTYLDNFRPSSSASTVHGGPNFAEILERTRAARDAASSPVPGAPRPPAEAPIDKTDKLYQLCLELETFIVKNLLTGMRNTVQKTGLVDDSFAGKMYEDMLYDEYAKEYTKSAGFGLAEQAYRQLSRLNG